MLPMIKTWMTRPTRSIQRALGLQAPRVRKATVVDDDTEADVDDTGSLDSEETVLSVHTCSSCSSASTCDSRTASPSRATFNRKLELDNSAPDDSSKSPRYIQLGNTADLPTVHRSAADVTSKNPWLMSPREFRRWCLLEGWDDSVTSVSEGADDELVPSGMQSWQAERYQTAQSSKWLPAGAHLFMDTSGERIGGRFSL